MQELLEVETYYVLMSYTWSEMCQVQWTTQVGTLP